jgi:predicted neuraminidase
VAIAWWIAAGLPCTAVVHAETPAIERVHLPALPGSRMSAYPSVDRLHDGRLLCVFSAANSESGGKLVLAGTFSEDDGRTWSQPTVLLDTADGDDYDPSIIVIGRRVIVSATTTPRGASTITTSRTMAVRSEDSGKTWSQSYEIPTGHRYTSGKINNGIVLNDGTALLGFTWEKNLDSGEITSLASEGDMEEVNAVLLSYDEGKTWASSKSVGLKTRKADAATGAINGLCEPALVECDDGSVFMLCRTGLTSLYASRSADGGRSWCEPFSTPLVGHNAPAALCRFDAKQRGILAVWNNSPTNRQHLSVAASFDGCRTWTAPIEIANEEGTETSYPGCVQTADGKILVVYQRFHKDKREIVGVRFAPSFPDESKTASSNTESRAQSTESSQVTAPRRAAHFDSMPKPAILPDGTLAAYFLDHEGPGLAATPRRQEFYVRYSNDHGSTWSSPESLVELPPEAGGFGYFVVLVDRDGEIHFFVLCDDGTGVNRPRSTDSGKSPVEPLAQQRLDVWHVRSTADRTKWTPPKRIWQGRAGDLQSVTQLSNGRIILPVTYYVDRNWSNRGGGLAEFTYTGQFDTTVLYSDDGGHTWQQSSSTLRTVTPDLASYGAVEPIVLQLRDGRVWMLLRTQLGRFYESFSDDGEKWSPARPTRITSSDSPAALARLPDQRILMLWNNCQRHPYAQGSRHVLHAAVSADEGASWTGYREILRDEHRSAPPPPNGDHGVSYPFVAVHPDGRVFYSLWVQTGKGRSLELLDPKWLDETSASENFRHRLEAWSTFGTSGASIAEDPTEVQKSVLSLVQQDTNWPTAAVWNFPKGTRGQLKFVMMLEKDSPAVSVQLADHFSTPADEQSHLYSVFHIDLSSAEELLPQQIQLPPDTWTEITFEWNCEEGVAKLSNDGKLTRTLRQQHTSTGPSYLRLAIPAGDGSPGRVLVRSVDVSVSNIQGQQARR